METQTTMTMWEKYLSTCPEKDRREYEESIRSCGPDPDWATLQRAFVKSIDQYLDVEIQKSLDKHLDNHEAGGQFRIAFPHIMVRSRDDVKEYMKAHLERIRKYAVENLYHGYVDCDEIHHRVETFIFFQNALLYYQHPGHETALESILDFAEHVGNWAEGVPDWYDWEKHGFVSTEMGTRKVKAYPPHDYQEVNHFRFVGEAVAAYTATKEQKYLDLICDYCDRWCDHIEAAPEHGPVACQILPEGITILETGSSDGFGELKEEGKYQIFYSILQTYTMVDAVNGLLDAYILTGNKRYLSATEKCIDQFFYNGDGNRPAVGYANGQWILSGSDYDNTWRPVYEGRELMPFCSEEFYLSKMVMRYTRMTGDLRYKEAILKWANDINEDEYQYDQMRANLFVAAHYMSGDERWLKRAYEMALRFRAVTEKDDIFFQCEQNVRQGSKCAVELLYTVMLGDSTFATRGEMPDPVFRYETDGVEGLNDKIALRIWYKGEKEYHFEAKNLSDENVKVCVKMHNGAPVTVSTLESTETGMFEVLSGANIKGSFAV